MTAHSICFWKSYLFTPHYWGFEKDWDNLLFATWEECLLKEDCKQDFSRNHGNSFKIYKNSIQIGSILTPSIYLHVMEIQSYLAVMVVNIFVIIITHITCLLKKLREGRKISIYRVCYINLFFLPFLVLFIWFYELKLPSGALSLFQYSFVSTCIFCTVSVKYVTFLYVIIPNIQLCTSFCAFVFSLS